MKRLLLLLTLSSGIFMPATLCAAVQKPSVNVFFQTLLEEFCKPQKEQSLGTTLHNLRGNLIHHDGKFDHISGLLEKDATEFAVYRGKKPTEKMNWFVLKGTAIYLLNSATSHWQKVDCALSANGSWEAVLSQHLSKEECKQHALPECAVVPETIFFGGGAAAPRSVTFHKVNYAPGSKNIISIDEWVTGTGEEIKPFRPLPPHLYQQLTDEEKQEYKEFKKSYEKDEVDARPSSQTIAGKDLHKPQHHDLVKKIAEINPEIGQHLESTIKAHKTIIETKKKESVISRLTLQDPENTQLKVFNTQSVIVTLAAATIIGACEFSTDTQEILCRGTKITRLAHAKAWIQTSLPERIKKSKYAQQALALAVASLLTWGVKSGTGMKFLQASADETVFIPNLQGISLTGLTFYGLYKAALYLIVPSENDVNNDVVVEESAPVRQSSVVTAA